MKQWLIPVGTLIVGVCIGALFSISPSSDQKELSQESSKTIRLSNKSQRTISDRASNSSSPSTQIERIISKYNRFSSAEFLEAATALKGKRSPEFFLEKMLLYSLWAEQDPISSLEFLEDQGRGYASSFGHQIVYGVWAKNSPLQAASYINQNKSNLDQRTIDASFAAIASKWAKDDPQASFDWLQTIDDENKSSALTRYFREIYETDSVLAEQYLSQLTLEDQKRSIRGIAEIWGNQDNWQKIEENISSLPLDLQKDAESSALTRYTRANPELAKEQISALQENDRLKNRLVFDVINQLGRADPQNTLEFGLANTSGGTQRRVARRVFDPWINSAPEEAVNWLSQQEPSSNKDQVIQSYLRRDNVDQQLYEQLFNQIQSEDLRERLIKK